MNQKQFKEISEWQNKTFGKATSLSKVNHLTQEVKELKKDLEQNNPHVRLEFADCFILLFGAAASHGFSYEDICCIISEKMEINANREWGEPDENGVVNHIKQQKTSY